MIDALYIKLLQRKCGIPATPTDVGTEFADFYDNEFMSYILDESSRRHNRKLFKDNLAELPAVYLLARIEVYTILAGAFAKNYDIGSKDGSLKKSQTFANYQKLIKQLTDDYNSYGKDQSVRSTPVLLTNSTRNIYRNFINAPEPSIDISVVDNSETEVQFKVIPLSNVAVTSLDFYLGTEPIYDLVEVNNINPTSTLVASVPYTTNTYQVTRDNTTKYLGVVAKNKYGKKYILEIDITYTPPQTTGTV